MLNYNNSFYIIVFLFSFYLILVSLFGDYKKQSFFHLHRLATILFKKENLFSVECGTHLRIRERIYMSNNIYGSSINLFIFKF